MRATPEVRLPEEALEFVARRFRVLGEPQRLRILRELMDGELCVGELTERCATSQGNVSKHLSQLRAEGLVGFRRQGSRKLYRIVDESLAALCDLMCDALAQRFSEHLRTLAEPVRVEHLSLPEVQAR
jgi:DNA-binding transcriptional ArsR family regulator